MTNRIMTPADELFAISTELERAAETGSSEDVLIPLNALQSAAQEVGRSFSGSWLGYHARVYYAELKPPPPRAHFSQEWGLKEFSYGTDLGISRGDWREFDPETVKDRIRVMAGAPDLRHAQAYASQAEKAFDLAQPHLDSILESELGDRSDTFLARLRDGLHKLSPLTSGQVLQLWSPQGETFTRDMVALGQGALAPPHFELLAEISAIRRAFEICARAARISRAAASHLERLNRRTRAASRIGTNVFIGHGRSNAWRELKDFIQDRLGLPWDEFNRVPVAGVTNIARLSEMLDDAAIAFLVMTGEDEMADGAIQARMNVIHEAGLFQGRLSFTKAIILLEHGCEEFSNIQGLGQIRFPKGNISASFEEVRRVLEREKVIEE
jgi:predicted nucleotide-binding protein